MSQVLPQTPVRKTRRLKPAALPGLGLGIAAVLLLLAIFFLVFLWPFRLDTVTKELADESDSKVTAGSFRATYFPKSPQAPMSGIVTFHAKVSVPPGEKLFLKKVELQGDFGVDAGSFTKTDTQQGVNNLSEGARGEKNPKPERDDPILRTCSRT